MSIFVKRFTAPMPGGDKTVRVFVPGVVVSLVIGIAGFVWLLVRHEWLAAFGGLVFGLASFTTMALAMRPNMRMFEAVDRAVAEKDGRRLARTVWLESFFLHAAKALSIFIAFVGPIFLLRERAANLLPAALFGLSLADPPHGFISDESGDAAWHATFRPFCQLVPIILFLGAFVWHLPLRSLVARADATDADRPDSCAVAELALRFLRDAGRRPRPRRGAAEEEAAAAWRLPRRWRDPLGGFGIVFASPFQPPTEGASVGPPRGASATASHEGADGAFDDILWNARLRSRGSARRAYASARVIW